jgi:hypothetical protein
MHAGCSGWPVTSLSTGQDNEHPWKHTNKSKQKQPALSNRGAVCMGMLEEKINRLPPHQQREVEDFVDFLLQRTENTTATLAGGSFLAPVPEPVSKPLIMAEDQTVSGRQDARADGPETGDLIRSPEPDDTYERKTGRPAPGKLLDWIN